MMNKRSIGLCVLGLFVAISAWSATRVDDDAFLTVTQRLGDAYAAKDKAAVEKAVAEAETKFAPKDAVYKELTEDYRALANGMSAPLDDGSREKTRIAVYKEAEILLSKKEYPRTGALLVDLCALYPGDRDVFGVLAAYHRARLGKEPATAISWQDSFKKVIAKRRATSVEKKIPAAMTENEKRVRLAKAREMIVSQDFAGAQIELTKMKMMLPDDKEVAALYAYAVSQKNATHVSAPQTPAVQNKDAASQGVARDLYYDGVRLYNEKKYKDAGHRFKQVVDLEDGGEEEYAPRARKILDAINQNIHKQVLGEILTDDNITDEMMLKHIDQNNTPPYLDPAKETASKDKTSLIEVPAIRKKLDKKTSFDFSDISIRHVAEYIQKETGVSVVLSQKVLEQKPRITAKFDNLSTYEAVRYMCKSADLAFRLEEDALWIATNGEMDHEAIETRVYRLKHGAGLLTEFSSSESSQAGVSSFATIKKIETLEDTLKSAVDWPAGAKVTLDKRTNSLLVSNTPRNLQDIEDILLTIDADPVQVLIESKFIEVDVTDLKELGVDWKSNSDMNVGGSTKTQIASGSGLDFLNFTNVAQGLNLTYKGVLSNAQFQVVLHALEQSKKTKTLSSPRVTTLNNQLATMKVIDEWVYPTKYELQTTTTDLNNDGDYTDPGETVTENAPLDFVRRDVGIILKVVPSVGSDNRTVTMSIIPEVSDAEANAFSYSSSVKLPKFSSRNLATSVAVDSGQTVVLGGLIKESRTNLKTKTPILGDIPFVGQLFRHDSENITRSSLLIFVTARILSSSGKEVAAE